MKNIPTINKAPRGYNGTEKWNYSPLVEKYYPENYIEDDMWNMNFDSYQDTPYDGGYKNNHTHLKKFPYHLQKFPYTILNI